MWRPVVPVQRDGAVTESMGLGFFLFDVNGHHLVGHTGDQGGFRSFMAFDPTSGEGVIGVVNTSNGVDPNSDAGFTAVVPLRTAAARPIAGVAPLMLTGSSVAPRRPGCSGGT